MTACVERLLRIDTNPTGARIVVSGLRPEGRIEVTTPIEIPFTHYGTVRIDAWQGERPGMTQFVELEPPWYERMPFDLFAELLDPTTHVDRHEITIALSDVPKGFARDETLGRAEELRQETR